jgi:hypothetical protein
MKMSFRRLPGQVSALANPFLRRRDDRGRAAGLLAIPATSRWRGIQYGTLLVLGGRLVPSVSGHAVDAHRLVGGYNPNLNVPEMYSFTVRIFAEDAGPWVGRGRCEIIELYFWRGRKSR